MTRARLIALAALVGFAGCMEIEQSSKTSTKQPGQTVRSDTAPWANEPLAMGPKWSKGDLASWD